MENTSFLSLCEIGPASTPCLAVDGDAGGDQRQAEQRRRGRAIPISVTTTSATRAPPLPGNGGGSPETRYKRPPLSGTIDRLSAPRAPLSRCNP
jgi:hypothetical protein